MGTRSGTGGDQPQPQVPGVATLYVVPGVTMLRPAEAVFEKMIEGFVEHQQARALKADTIAGRVRTVRQLHCGRSCPTSPTRPTNGPRRAANCSVPSRRQCWPS